MDGRAGGDAGGEGNGGDAAPVNLSGGLRIYLLGGFRVSVDGVPVHDGAWRLSKAKTLVKLLALAEDRRILRTQVEALLWPDLPPQAAAHNLRTTLHASRAALANSAAAPGREQSSGTWITADRSVVALAAPNLWIDVAAFEKAAAAALGTNDPSVCRTAVGAYGGQLLPEDLYDDSVATRREALLARYIAVLLHAAVLHERRHEHDAATEALRRVVEAAPTHEAAHASLMRLYAQMGDRSRAVRQFQLLREILRRQVDTAPAPATHDLYRQIVEWDFAWRRSGSLGAVEDAAMGAGPEVKGGGGAPPDDATVIAVGPEPHGVAIFAPAHRLYVTMSGGREVWGIDCDTYEVVSRTVTSSHPHGLAVNVQAGRVYVANYMNRSVSILDAWTGERLGRGVTPEGKLPRGVAVDPATNLVYVTTRRNMPSDSVEHDSLMIFDGETMGLVASLAVGEMPMGVVVASASRRAYVAAQWSNAVAVVDIGQRRVIAMVPVVEGPCSIAMDETAGFLYVVGQENARLSVVDCASLSVVATVPVGVAPYGVAVDATARRAYVANTEAGTVTIVDTAMNTVLGTVDGGRSPMDVALSPTGDRLFVTNFQANTVTVLGMAELLRGMRPSQLAQRERA